jgi:hypothetical protein
MTTLGVGGAGAPSLPALTGLVAWYKTESLAVGDGNPVSQWDDSSGNGNHVTQGTGSKQPIYRASGINGRPALEFSKANDTCLIDTAPSGFDSTGVTIYVVMQPITWTTWGMIVVLNPANVELRCRAPDPQLDYGWLTDGAVELVQDSGEGSPPFVARILSARFNDVTNFKYLQISGQTEDFAAEGDPASYTQICLGARDNADTTLNLDGYLGEALIYAGELGATDRSQTVSYLSGRWGLSL